MTSSTALAILKRIVAALIGYVVLFSAYLAIFNALSGAPIVLRKIAGITLNTFILPFTDAQTKIHILGRLHTFVPTQARAASVAAVTRDLRYALATEVVLFIALVLVIFIFERSRRKSPHSVMIFYAVMPALLWILWSQCYLFI